MFADLEKRPKSAAHFGLFATRNIPAGVVIIPKWHEDFYVGMEGWQFLTVDEILHLPPPKKRLFFRYGLDVGFSQIVGPSEERHVTTLDNFINHSCEPTLTYDYCGNVITASPLRQDAELTIDYGCFTVNFDEAFDCECGSRTCRRRVRRDDWRKLAPHYGYAMPRFLHEHIRAVLDC
jgi:SET domain